MRPSLSAGAAVLAGVAYGVSARLGFGGEVSPENAITIIATVVFALVLAPVCALGYAIAAGRVRPVPAILLLVMLVIVGFLTWMILVVLVALASGVVLRLVAWLIGSRRTAGGKAALRRAVPWLAGLLVIGFAYLAAAQLVAPPAGAGVMSLAFVALVPLAVGYLSVALNGRAAPRMRGAILPSVIATAACMAIVLASGLEGAICVMLALPVFLAAAVLGGMLAALVRSRLPGARARWALLAGILVLPYAGGVLENRVPLPDARRTVVASVRIHADAATAWRNVVRPTGIRPEENQKRLAQRMGFPLPVTATLSQEGLGGSRFAIFEHGVILRETVTEWAPGRRMAFLIDPANIPASVLDEHVTIGGPFFDVLDGAYEVVPIAPGEVELRLTTTHRLSTHFNPYAGFWTDLLMRQIQENLLHVVRTRAEAGR
jgi:hypothetical protein